MICDDCGGALEPSAYGGYIHADDSNDDHTPVTRERTRPS